ncbi:hypothetical protein N7925_09475 [Streptomyces sp. CA-278952]|nr:hypothetical protein [Streptomyces sp. CA-278952]WDG33773.1 hypothetical protein N7925_09475 [Streptomyces sp. CA-278952]
MAEPVERGRGVAGVAGVVVGRPGDLGGVCGSDDAWRWSTGISAGWAVAGVDGTVPAGPSAPAGLAPAGISRSGLPRAGRTTSAEGRPESRPGDGASPSRTARSGPLRRSDPARWTAGAAAAADGAVAEEEAEEEEGDAEEEGAEGAVGVAGTSPAICRSGIAGRRATISGGAIRCGRTAAGVRAPEDTDDPDGAVEPDGAVAEDGSAGPDAADVPGVPDVRGRPGPPDVRDPPTGDRFAVCVEADGAGDEPRDGARAALDRWTVGEPGRGAPVPVPLFVLLPLPATTRLTEAGGRSVVGAAGSSAPGGRTARSSSGGPPGDVVRAPPGRATPWMRPTGADGRTEWPSSPPRAGFCQEASRERNRSPSLTPIEDRATVTVGGATRRQPPSQPPPSPPEAADASEAAEEPEAEPESVAGPWSGPESWTDGGTADTPMCPAPSREGAPARCRSARRSQSPNPTRSPAFVDAGVDPRYLPHPLLTFAVGEVENVLTLPMEVVGDVRDLLPQPGKRVRHDSPRRPPERSTSNDPWHSGQVTAACVWPSLLIRR